MKIGYDAKRAFENQTGLGNYSRDLINTCSLLNPKFQILLFASKIFQNKRLDFLKSRDNIKIVKPNNFFHRFFQSTWRSFGILTDLKKEKVDIFHGLSHEIPFGINKTKIKTVVTIHDLIFLRLQKIITKALCFKREWGDQLTFVIQKIVTQILRSKKNFKKL